VEASERLHRPNQDAPDLLLCKKGLLFLVLDNLLIDVPLAGKVHNDAKALVLINERVLVANDVLVMNARQNPHFIYGIFTFLLTEVLHRDLLESVHLVVALACYFEDFRVGACTELTLNCEVFKFGHKTIIP
jgi:hypothetical protein